MTDPDDDTQGICPCGLHIPLADEAHAGTYKGEPCVYCSRCWSLEWRLDDGGGRDG